MQSLLTTALGSQPSERENLLRAIFDNEPECVKLIGPDGVLLELNRAGLRMIEAESAEQVLGKSIYPLVAPEHREALAGLVSRVFHGESDTLEFEIVGLKGSRRWLETHAAPLRNSAGQVVCMLGITRDITDRKRAEDALRQAERRFRALVENSSDGISLLGADQAVLYVSPSTTRMLGYSAEELVGRDPLDFIHPDDHQRMIELLADIRQQPGTTCSGECRARHKDGSWRWVEVVGQNLLAEPSVRAIVANFRDVTARKHAAELLAEHSQRLQNLSRRLIDVQETERRRIARELHDDIGNALTGLLFTLDAAVATVPPSAATKLNEARTDLAELLEHVRESSLALRPAMLDHLGLLPALLWLIDHFTKQTGVQVTFKHSGLENRFAPDVETAAYRIVQESLTNVARHAGVREATVRAWINGDTVLVQIEDNGVGFDPPSVLAIPNMAGLAGMQERVMLLNGTLTIGSEPGKGTQITAELPLTESEDGGEIP